MGSGSVSSTSVSCSQSPPPDAILPKYVNAVSGRSFLNHEELGRPLASVLMWIERKSARDPSAQTMITVLARNLLSQQPADHPTLQPELPWASILVLYPPDRLHVHSLQISVSINMGVA